IESRPLKLVEIADPAPGPRYLLVRVRACGVCHTDLHIVEGDIALPHLPTVPGHEIVGIVEEVGPGVTRFQVGERVGIPWLHEACGECHYCGEGKENLCSNISFTGLHVDGGYEELTLVHEGFAYSLPDTFDDVSAAPLLCAGVVGYRALRMSGIKPGQNLGMYGFGASAHVVIQIARYWDCKVFVFTRSAGHREFARSLGASWAESAEDDPGALMDSSIIFAPSGALVPTALERLDHGGTLVLGGIHMSAIPAMPYDLLWHERTIQSVANSTRQDVVDFLQIAAEIPIATRVQTFPLEEANEALGLLKSGRLNGAAVLTIE
ncbi:MAG TPA: zinc-dependent alcohol dehydrogenase family protein, partial [Spirochaetia bacterium]|nr:zinc-dependent alcohol dehydrogenase family protein [Spirochaetia bacterium]